MAEARDSGKVVTRFAPSPTGFLHIGGARTALFNYLFARAQGGKFLLRIEDTDRARSTDAAIAAILDGMDWLGLAADEPPVFQFARAARHAEVANDLLASGHAYRCYATPAELETMRAEQRAAKLPMRYDGRWRDRTETPDLPYVIRLRAPKDGSVTIDDRVQGAVTVANAELDDMVLLRSDGTPTYMLAVVVDDEDMGVTHVIRGDDHLNNAFRQLALIRAANFREPVYAHVPLIHGADGAKLSKRHGALGVDAYRDEMGMLPEAVENYLLRLGWGHGDEEFMTRARAVEVFDLGGIGRGPARFDLKKLENVNGHYLRLADDARLVGLVAPRLTKLLERAPTPEETARLTALMRELKQRATNLDDLAASALFLCRARPWRWTTRRRSCYRRPRTGSSPPRATRSDRRRPGLRLPSKQRSSKWPKRRGWDWGRSHSRCARQSRERVCRPDCSTYSPYWDVTKPWAASKTRSEPAKR